MPMVPAAEVEDAAAQHVLLATWLSPAFPIGGFSYSHGLEVVIADGSMADGSSLEDWLALLIERGSGWNDALLLAEAWRAGASGDLMRLEAAAGLGAALAVSAERHLETTALGAAFLAAIAGGWPTAATDALAASGAAVPYPVAVGAAAGGHGLPLASTLAMFVNAFAASLVSVAVRLVPLGQTEGLKVLAGLRPLVLDCATRAEAANLDALGSAALMSDIAALRHETLHSRVFRS